jgi:hypothetical protein
MTTSLASLFDIVMSRTCHRRHYLFQSMLLCCVWICWMSYLNLDQLSVSSSPLEDSSLHNQLFILPPNSERSSKKKSSVTTSMKGHRHHPKKDNNSTGTTTAAAAASRQNNYWIAFNATKDNPVPVVMGVSGELGNYMHYLAHGYGIFRLARQNYGIHTKMVFRKLPRSPRKTVKRTVQTIQTCFPWFQYFDLKTEFDLEEYRKKQRLVWGSPQVLGVHNKPQAQPAALQNNLRQLQRTILKMSEMMLEEQQARTFTGEDNPSSSSSSSSISPPYITVGYMKNYAFLDRYYEQYQELFSMDEDKCCRQLPEEDETVFVSQTRVPCRVTSYLLLILCSVIM